MGAHRRLGAIALGIAAAIAGCGNDRDTAGAPATPVRPRVVTTPNGAVISYPPPPTTYETSPSDGCRDGGPPTPGLRASLTGRLVRFDYDVGDPPASCHPRRLSLLVSHRETSPSPLGKQVTLGPSSGSVSLRIAPYVQLARGSIASATLYDDNGRSSHTEVLVSAGAPGRQLPPATNRRFTRGTAAYNDLCVIKYPGQPRRLQSAGVAAHMAGRRTVLVEIDTSAPPRCPPKTVDLRVDDPHDPVPAVTRQVRVRETSTRVAIRLPAGTHLGPDAIVTAVTAAGSETPSLPAKAEVLP